MITIQNRPPNTPSTPSGPTTGYTAIQYTFTTSATDPDGNRIQYTFNWGDGQNTTTGFYDSGSTVSAKHTWSKSGTYNIKVRANDTDGASSGWSSLATINIENAPPNTPARPSGTTSCAPNSTHEYSVYASDPDGENVHCIFDWGDGATTVTSTLSSGSLFKASHTWDRLGTFSVKVKVIDSAGKESPWSQPTTVEVKLTSSMTIATSLSAVARGEKLAVNGSIKPPHAATVTLTYGKPDGSQIIVQVKSDQNGNFNDVIAPSAVGTWSVRASWSGDDNHFGSSTSPITFVVDPALCSVTFESNATGISMLVDGLNSSLPQSFRWLEGTAHTVIVEESHYFSTGGRYVFKRWDDGHLDRSRKIII
ncbi:PKD domain-containing protein, partial [bacterium]